MDAETKIIDAVLDAGSRLIALQDAFDRCVELEGTPAIKDLAQGYRDAVGEMFRAQIAAANAMVNK